MCWNEDWFQSTTYSSLNFLQWHMALVNGRYPLMVFKPIESTVSIRASSGYVIREVTVRLDTLPSPPQWTSFFCCRCCFMLFSLVSLLFFTHFNSSLVPSRVPPELSMSLALSFLSFSPTNTRHISAAAKGRDLLPGGDGCSVHASRTGADCTAFSLQQCRRVPRRRQGNQPQVARADIRHWYFAALPVHAGSTPGEDKFCIFVWFLESWLHSVVVCKFAY